MILKFHKLWKSYLALRERADNKGGGRNESCNGNSNVGSISFFLIVLHNMFLQRDWILLSGTFPNRAVSIFVALLKGFGMTAI